MAMITARYAPPPPPGLAPPHLWGDPRIVSERLGSAVKEITFDRSTMIVPALSPQHFRSLLERAAGPMIKLVESLSDDPTKLAAFRREYDELIAEYYENNLVRLDYLMTRATKASTAL
jgi:hypothetical protein